MQAKVGDHIVVESETVGTPTRQGEVIDVIQGEVGVRFHVRWEDGHETTFTPSAGSVRVIAKTRSKAASKTRSKAGSKR